LNPVPCLSRRTLLAATGLSLGHASGWSQQPLSLRIAAPGDVLDDYRSFLGAREPAELRSFDGPFARRDVMELALLLREIQRQLPQARTELVAIDSYQRGMLELRTGRISALGTSAWRVDLAPLGDQVHVSTALLRRGDFVVGLYAAPDNRKALEARTLRALRGLSAVSNSDWSVDWSTLKALGMRQISDVKVWRQMVLSVAYQRADVLLAPFPNTNDLVLEAEGVRLLPLREVSIALQGSRHLAASTTPGGQAIASQVFPAIATLAANGALKRAYRECGFINPRTSPWPVLNA
jgi:hypothetical protein